MKYGIQLFSCRDAMAEDMKGTLTKLADIGYKYVETAGFFGHSAEQIKEMLDACGLEVSGTHTGCDALVEDKLEETIAFHKGIGTDTIIIPGFDYSQKKYLDDFIDLVNAVQPKLEAQGMKLAFHNHSGEFIPTAYGAIVQEEIANRTKIDFEIDTYWAFHAGLNPIDVLEKYKNRINVIHIKDGLASGEGKPLGLGEAPVADVYKKALQLGLQIVVESETQIPDGITEAKICFEYLKSLESK